MTRSLVQAAEVPAYADTFRICRTPQLQTRLPNMGCGVSAQHADTFHQSYAAVSSRSSACAHFGRAMFSSRPLGRAVCFATLAYVTSEQATRTEHHWDNYGDGFNRSVVDVRNGRGRRATPTDDAGVSRVSG